MTARILHVAQPGDAGVAAVVRSLSTYEAGIGAEVHVAGPPGTWLADQLAGTDVPHHPWAATRSPGPSTVAETRSLAAVVRRVRPAVVVLHSAKAGLAGRLALRGALPTVFAPHAWSFEAVEGPVAAASRWWERTATRWTHELLCLSDHEVAVGARAGVDVSRAHVVPNGVDVDHYVPAPAVQARGALGLAAGPVAVCVGRLSRQKGQDRLLEAWPLVRDRVPDAELVLVGDGPDRDSLQAAAPDGVRLAGSTADARPWLQAADVVVLPSRWEGMALVPLEAMACGRSVVGTDVGGLGGLLRDAGASLPVDASARDLADAVATRLLDPVLAAGEGRQGRDRVVGQYAAGVAGHRMHAVVVEALRHARGRS